MFYTFFRNYQTGSTGSSGCYVLLALPFFYYIFLTHSITINYIMCIFCFHFLSLSLVWFEPNVHVSLMFRFSLVLMDVCVRACVFVWATKPCNKAIYTVCSLWGNTNGEKPVFQTPRVNGMAYGIQWIQRTNQTNERMNERTTEERRKKNVQQGWQVLVRADEAMPLLFRCTV